MLKMDPRDRESALSCLERGDFLSLFNICAGATELGELELEQISLTALVGSRWRKKAGESTQNESRGKERKRVGARLSVSISQGGDKVENSRV